jgi:hypothetical protein
MTMFGFNPKNKPTSSLSHKQLLLENMALKTQIEELNRRNEQMVALYKNLENFEQANARNPRGSCESIGFEKQTNTKGKR